jgi:hypothetical protein
MRDWLERHEAFLRAAFRIAVLTLLGLSWWELHEIERQTVPMNTWAIERQIEGIGRDVERLKDRLAP